MQIVEYYTKNVYGKTHNYLVDSDAAKTILSLIGQKTITDQQMAQFGSLGVVFKRVFEPGS